MKLKKLSTVVNIEVKECYYVLNSHILELDELLFEEQTFSHDKSDFEKQSYKIKVEENETFISVFYYIKKDEELSEEIKSEMRMMLYNMVVEKNNKIEKQLIAERKKIKELFKKDLREKKFNRIIK